MSTVNHVFEKSMKPLILEQSGRGPSRHGPNKTTVQLAKTIMDYIRCIQSPEWAAATAHKIAQELPPGQINTDYRLTRITDQIPQELPPGQINTDYRLTQITDQIPQELPPGQINTVYRLTQITVQITLELPPDQINTD